MGDLISRKALIAEYDRVHVGPPGGARKLMEDAPSVEAEPKWIPCSERMPETDNWRTTFIVTTDKGKTKAMEWENTTVRNKPVTRWIWHDVISPWNVVAWMPLPEPYKEEKQ